MSLEGTSVITHSGHPPPQPPLEPALRRSEPVVVEFFCPTSVLLTSALDSQLQEARDGCVSGSLCPWSGPEKAPTVG